MSNSESRVSLWSQLPLVAGLILLWMLLWGEFTLNSLIFGTIVSFFVVVVFYLPRVGLSGKINPSRTVIAAAVFAYDVVHASIKVVVLSMRFGYQPQNAIVKVQLRSRDDLLMMLTAEAISLVPATIVVEQDRNNGILYLHALDVKNMEGIERVRRESLAQERRLILALGSDHDKALIHAEDREKSLPSRVRYARKSRISHSFDQETDHDQNTHGVDTKEEEQ